MSDEEFDVLDELYFVQSFNHLLDNCDLGHELLVKTLENLWKNGWIKVLVNVDEEEKQELVDISKNAKQYFFLATKKVLLAHNTLN
jgi:hypothetical protein